MRNPRRPGSHREAGALRCRPEGGRLGCRDRIAWSEIDRRGGRGTAAMARLFEVLAASAAVLLAMAFGLGLSASGSWEAGARWHVRIGLASTAVCLVAHLSAIAL